MPVTPDLATASLDSIAAWIADDRLPPVEQWHPPHAGRIDIRIDSEGRWWHEGGEITRPAMVRAFSRLLRREGDGGYVLVTPAEKLAITVEDAPLIAVEARIDGEGDARRIVLRLNSDLMVPIDASHPLVLRDGPAGWLPYLNVSGPDDRRVEARLARSVWYELADLADADGSITSNGAQFALAAPA